MGNKAKNKVATGVGSAKPYVDRALHDAELRDNVKNAYTAARQVYDELVGRRGLTGAAQRVAGDKDIQDNLRRTIEAVGTAAVIARWSAPGTRPLAVEMSLEPSRIAPGVGARLAAATGGDQTADARIRTSVRCFHASR